MFHGNTHRHLLILSLVNWAVAIVCWTISAYLGSAVPTGIFVYTVLFVIGLFAVIVALGSFVLADFGTEPNQPAVAAATAGAGPDAGIPDTTAPDVGEKPAGNAPGKPGFEAADKPADKPAETPTAEAAEKPAAAKNGEAPADKTAGSGA